MTGTAPAPAKALFMPQLDALRAIAVFLVFVHHLLNPGLLPQFLRLEWGHYGVRLFFVLSGFLITGILIRARDATQSLPERLYAARQFFVRRFLRIFPLYYFILFAGLLLGVDDIRDNAISLLTYTFNFKLAEQNWYPDTVSHLWSLAVEEQFYVFWPWVVLFVASTKLKWWTLAMVAIGPLWRYFALAAEMNPLAYYVSTPACLDSLGAGALLAVASSGKPVPEHVRRRLTRVLLPLALAALAVLQGVLGPLSNRESLIVYWYDTVLAVFFCCIVAGASVGFRGPLGWFFQLPPVLYLGRIAYGLYVYHLLVQDAVFWAGNALGLEWENGDLLNFLATSGTTVLVATLSWYLLERPINELKSRFDYVREPAKMSAVA